MENAPSVVNHLVKSPAGKSEAEKGGRIIQKGNNSAKAVSLRVKMETILAKLQQDRPASRTYNWS